MSYTTHLPNPFYRKGILGLVGVKYIHGVSQDYSKSLIDIYSSPPFMGNSMLIGLEKLKTVSLSLRSLQYRVKTNKWLVITIQSEKHNDICMHGVFRSLLEDRYVSILRIVCQGRCPLVLMCWTSNKRRYLMKKILGKESNLFKNLYERMRHSKKKLQKVFIAIEF